MNFVKSFSYTFILALLILVSAIPAMAIKVQVFQPAEEGKSISEVRSRAIDKAFSQAILSEALRMIPNDLTPGRADALQTWLGDRKDTFVTGYRDRNVSQEENGVSVSLNVDVNRKDLREYLKKIGVYYTSSNRVEANVTSPFTEDQTDDLADLNNLLLVFGIIKTDSLSDVSVTISNSGKNFIGNLSTSSGRKFKSYGNSLEIVWSKLWENYFKTVHLDSDLSNKTTLEVSGWFSPDGVRDFDRVLKSWDAAVQEVKLGGLEMKPTAVSAIWTLDVGDQWLLKSYLNDYLPQRGLNYTISGLEGN